MAKLLGSLIGAISLMAILAHVAGTAQAETWSQKVDPWVMATAAGGSETEFLVYLAEQADLSGAKQLATKQEKGAYVYGQLTALAARTQPPLLSNLSALGLVHRSFWIANMIWVRGDANDVMAIAQRSDVAHIYANPAVLMSQPGKVGAEPQTSSATEWNIDLVNAPDLWAAGYTGQGTTIGGQDTGYDWDHPALLDQYRGWNGITATHDYNWHDAIHTSGSPCVADSPEPCDDDSHGTHTMGTMIGDDGASNQVGMAPGARWIGCRNMKLGVGTPATYAECYQWFIAPTDLNNANPDPAKAPHVINNSWSCPPGEGCTDPNVLLTVVDNVRAAGIVTVHSAGNEGPACGTVQDPAAIYDSSFSVGATSSTDAIASFSSRGPVTIDGSNRRKPDISAPGVGIRSSVPGTGYGLKSGTSMSGPHVAGLVALLISAEPSLAGNVDAIETIIQQSAVPLTTSQGCGGDGPTDVPNHVFGYGRIDALAAYQALTQTLLVDKSAPALVQSGELLTYTFRVTNPHPYAATNLLVLTDVIPANTSFFTASLPHTSGAGEVRWQLGQLAAGATWERNLVVQPALVTNTTIIENLKYGVLSQEVTGLASGPPVTTTVSPLSWPLYLPVLFTD